jgi:hypothetical protein
MTFQNKTYNRRWEAIAARMQANRPIIGAEIGVWRGQMSEKLLEIMPKLHLIMIDWWKAPPPSHSYFEGSLKISRMSDDQLQAAYNEAMKNVAGFPGRYTVLRMESTAAAVLYAKKSFDFVFLDGDHSYEGMMRDLFSWGPTVKSGGYLGGHDWAHPQQGKVKEAVTEYFHNRISDIELDVNRTWFIRM